MKKIDWIVEIILVSFIISCFIIDTKWSFLVAGICSPIAIAIFLGHIFQQNESKENLSSWDSFLDTLDNENTNLNTKITIQKEKKTKNVEVFSY